MSCSLLAQHVSKRFYDILLAPPLSVTLNERTGISAAEMLMYMHVYFLADPDADHREVRWPRLVYVMPGTASGRLLHDD